MLRIFKDELLNPKNFVVTLAQDFVPPRIWELHKTSSWINFHLGRDHQKKKIRR